MSYLTGNSLPIAAAEHPVGGGRQPDAFDKLVISRHLETAQTTESNDNFVVNREISGGKSYGKSRLRGPDDDYQTPLAASVGDTVDSDEDVDLDAYVNNRSSKVVTGLLKLLIVFIIYLLI